MLLVLYAPWSRNCKGVVQAFPYARRLFFRLTAWDRLARLPQVFAAGAFTTA